MAQKAAIKNRIKSVDTTKKITKAMELMATVKFQKQTKNMLKNKQYFDTLKDTMSHILSGNFEIESDYLTTKNNPKKIVFVFLSDIGLCGGYNINVIKYLQENYTDNAEFIVIGTSKYSLCKQKFTVLNKEIGSDETDYGQLKKLADYAIGEFRANRIGSIDVVYTKYINSVSFEPTSEVILPCSMDFEDKKPYKELLLEPNPNDIINHLIPMFVENYIYSKWLETKTAEQGSRRFAMQNATDNAEELTEELSLQYNQARQAAITQEITEIVGGADAL